MGSFVMIIMLVIGGDRAAAVSQEKYANEALCHAAEKAVHDMESQVKTVCVRSAEIIGK